MLEKISREVANTRRRVTFLAKYRNSHTKKPATTRIDAEVKAR